MYKKKLMLPALLAVFCFLIAMGSLAAADNSTFNDDLTITEDNSSPDQLNSIEKTDTLNSDFNESSLEKSISDQSEDEYNEHLEKSDENNLTVIDNASDEILSVPVNSTEGVLSSSVSVSSSSGHIFYKGGYKFKVSANQYKKIRQAIKVGKKQKFLDWGFEFKVKTNKIHKHKKPIYKNKKVTAYKWKYKKVRVSQETYWKWEYRFYADKTKTKSGWICYKLSETDFDYGVANTHYVHFKKKVKYKTTKKVKTGNYKIINMRVYANINYVGSEDYVTGEHGYFPWVSFIAMKKGYKDNYLGGILLK